MTAREHGILFQDEMVRAILDGRKDVTRRASDMWAKRKPGDRLWVRECWGLASGYTGDLNAAIRYRADGAVRAVTAPKPLPVFASVSVWRPSIHMPRWASRLTLEIVDLRREETFIGGGLGQMGIALPSVTDEEARREGVAHRPAYLTLWRQINGETYEGGLWRIEFRVVGGAA